MHPLARRIEDNRRDVARAYVERHRAVYADGGATVFDLAGGVVMWATRYGAPSISRAFCVGLESAVTEDDLARIEAFYADKGAPARITTTPFSDPSLFAALGKRGWAITQWDSVLARPLDDLPSASTDVAIERIDRSRAIEWAQLIERGLGRPAIDPSSDRMRAIAEVLLGTDTAFAYIATRDGEPAGGAGLVTRDGIATLYATSTIAEHRRRGVQGSLIAARLAHARSLGCDLAIALTFPGSDSQRNLERSGFRLVYHAPQFERAL